MHFRYDINGLRAYAVLFVVLFHFGIGGFGAGFIGVDIFFVISGYLMTKIIMQGLEAQRFSLLRFYSNRGIRIIPALVVLCIALLFYGWFFLIASEYQTLAKDIISSLSFSSNIFYWLNAGYFDSSSHQKLLLHSWSLSVEWQFYLLLPIFTLLAYRYFQQKLLWLYVLVFALSLCTAQYLAYAQPDAAYYLLPSRAWEMILGGIVYFLPKYRLHTTQQIALESLGIILIVIALCSFDQTTPWASCYSLIPTFAAACILYAQRQNSYWTNNFFCQFLGASSYSIYLWHWPIVAILNQQQLQHNGYYIFAGLLSSILLGYLSAHYIENNLGNALKRLNDLKINLIIIASCGSIILLSIVIYYSHGANTVLRPATKSAKAQFIEKYKNLHQNLDDAYWLKCDAYFNLNKNGQNKIDPSCIQAHSTTHSIFLWGDSHAQALSLGLRQAFPQQAFYQVTSSGCKASLTPSAMRGEFKQACDYANKQAIESIQTLKPYRVVIAQQNLHHQNDWSALIKQLKNLGVQRISIIGAVPQWQPSLPEIVAKDLTKTLTQVELSNTGLMQSIIKDDAQAKQIVDALAEPQVQYISLISQMCYQDQQQFACRFQDGHGELLQVDYGHLSPIGSNYVVEHYIKKLLN
ncbi:acyltransferase family protein [Acinetobacter larvae]|uniref:Acyltransferase n=1 Tax=Acinetobacter larvae TaxID=1789224 RepID=A0A1B2LZJ1_9GAMM|nr:acyltransferase family protein [Acinetobacter larvae]AOA58355.1 hypothetical protein BFG52_08305 [Acinetobacter larvae]